MKTVEGFEHRLLLYDGDSHLLQVTIPFLEEGLRAGEAAVVAAGPAVVDLVTRALPPRSQVLFDLQYGPPLTTMDSRRHMVSRLIEEGARGVRMLGEVPHPGIGTREWAPWAQYEAAINQCYADLPLTGMCVYDRRSTPAHVAEDVTRLHPLIVDETGRLRSNDRFTSPRRFLEEQAARPDPLERWLPTVEYHDVSEPRRLRARLWANAHHAGLDGPEVDNFVLAVNEAASRALMEGAGPIRVRAWLSPDRLVGVVNHPRPGPDPLDGFLVPPLDETEELRVSIARRFTRRVDIRTGREWTIRLVAYQESYRGKGLSPDEVAAGLVGSASLS